MVLRETIELNRNDHQQFLFDVNLYFEIGDPVKIDDIFDWKFSYRTIFGDEILESQKLPGVLLTKIHSRLQEDLLELVDNLGASVMIGKIYEKDSELVKIEIKNPFWRTYLEKSFAVNSSYPKSGLYETLNKVIEVLVKADQKCERERYENFNDIDSDSFYYDKELELSIRNSLFQYGVLSDGINLEISSEEG